VQCPTERRGGLAKRQGTNACARTERRAWPRKCRNVSARTERRAWPPKHVTTRRQLPTSMQLRYKCLQAVNLTSRSEKLAPANLSAGTLCVSATAEPVRAKYKSTTKHVGGVITNHLDISREVQNNGGHTSRTCGAHAMNATKGQETTSLNSRSEKAKPINTLQVHNLS
jgi:hypothetical protein